MVVQQVDVCALLYWGSTTTSAYKVQTQLVRLLQRITLSHYSWTSQFPQPELEIPDLWAGMQGPQNLLNMRSLDILRLHSNTSDAVKKPLYS
jgi:hypothetical protein